LSARPEVQRYARNVIHARDSEAVLRQVDRLDVLSATIARIDPDVCEAIAAVHGQRIELLFSTHGADDPKTVPLGQAEGAHERPFRTMALFSQDADDGQHAAERTANGTAMLER
jgi:hypothetical protein